MRPLLPLVTANRACHDAALFFPSKSLLPAPSSDVACGSLCACSYSTYAVHFKEVECFQQQIEQLLYDGGADFVFAGHVHAYERWDPQLRYTYQACGPIHITIGDGGNVEGVRLLF